MPEKDAGSCTVILIEQFTVNILVGTPVMSDPSLHFYVIFPFISTNKSLNLHLAFGFGYCC